jgi:valyl-tRNA synthetase
VNVGEGWDGLKLAEAREKVLATPGLIEKEEALTHNVAKCYRCGSTIEPMLSKQWFLKMGPLAEKAIAAIQSGKVKYYPERWTPIAVNWLENIRDWCVSRQIWWGHDVPVENSTDTFDTWFSSALWPFAALGWPEKTSDLATYYPTSAITSARDILHLWITRMIFSGIEFMGEVPFHEVFIHATILTKDGKRMSKSLGTGIDPLVLIDKYGADATRFGLMYQALGGQDVHFNEDVLVMGKKFCNKLWNINRFALQKAGGDENVAWAVETPLPAALDFTKESPENHDILEKLELLVTSVNKRIAGYDFGQAAHELYDFAWHDFADVFIEASKNSESGETKKTAALVQVTLLKLLHPFMPFITEEMWAQWNAREMLIVSAWPK